MIYYEVMTPITKSKNLQTLIAKLDGWSEEQQMFIGWHRGSPTTDMEFVNDVVNPQFTDNTQRCVCYQRLMHRFPIVNAAGTQYAIIGCKCIEWFPDELRREYNDWRDEKAGVQKCIICDKKMRTKHNGETHNRCRDARDKKQQKYGQQRLMFGKHRGETWLHVYEHDPSYIRFVFSDKFKPYGGTAECIKQLREIFVL